MNITKKIIAAVAIVLTLSAAAWSYTEDANSNTFAGLNAGTGLTNGGSGQYNSFFGWYAGSLNNSGSYNSFFGAFSGYLNVNSSSNSFFGQGAGYNNTGNNNSFLGENAGYYNNSGEANSYMGTWAGNISQTGSNNVYVGSSAGGGMSPSSGGSGNVFIGYWAGLYMNVDSTDSNKLYIDNCAIMNQETGACDMPLIYGEFDSRIVQINGSLTMTAAATSSDIRFKKNIKPLTESLDKVMQLKGVSYEWKVDENPGRGFTNGRQIGLIAQDVEKVIPEVVTTTYKGYKALAYERLVPVLVEAIKEQHAAVVHQGSAIDRDIKTIGEQKNNLTAQKMELEKQSHSLEGQKRLIEDGARSFEALSVKLSKLEAEVNMLKRKDMTAQK
ncbi:MAG TPA: tail fiber domain-containing protein [Dissulfurispiraceae bacterium]|nr:tail fiber domain-containing protein [Dissulfurispiraceae bacterium]